MCPEVAMEPTELGLADFGSASEARCDPLPAAIRAYGTTADLQCEWCCVDPVVNGATVSGGG